jgi:hypothetical protein
MAKPDPRSSRSVLQHLPRVSGSLGGRIACVGLLLASACASLTELVPLVPSRDGVAVVADSGLELSAKAQPGSHAIPLTLVPIQISIKNLAPTGVYVSLDDIELELEGEGTAEAVPPTRIKARRPVGLGIDPSSPFASQAPTSGTAVAAPGGGAIPETTVGYAAGKSAVIDPVKREILDTAFWGGYIDTGETEEGLVYFARPPDDVARLRLRVRVRPRGSSAPVRTLEIPYSVQS